MKVEDVAMLISLKGEFIREVHWELDEYDNCIKEVTFTLSDGTVIEFYKDNWGIR